MPTNESHTAGWALTAEMCRWMQLRTIEYHPGGGQNDCLRLTTDGHFLARLAEWETYAFDINLGGSVHIIGSPNGARSAFIPQQTWVDAYREGELTRLARDILRSAGFDPVRAVSTYAEGLTVQVAAAILRICADDASDWKIQSVWRDDDDGLNLSLKSQRVHDPRHPWRQKSLRSNRTTSPNSPRTLLDPFGEPPIQLHGEDGSLSRSICQTSASLFLYRNKNRVICDVEEWCR